MAPPREHQLLQLLSLFILISALLIAWRAVPCSDDPFGAVEHPMCRPSKSSGRVSPPPMPQRPGDDEPRRPSSSFTVRKKNGMPQVPGAVLSRFAFTSPAGAPLELEAYIDASQSGPGPETRTVIIVAHGHDRDAWAAFGQASAARAAALGRGAAGPIAIVAPVFFNGLDKSLYNWGSKDNAKRLLVWKGNGWGQGEAAQYPPDNSTGGPDGAAGPGIGTFGTLDVLGAHFADRKAFPHLERIVYAGHSMGGQLMQRYSILGGGIPATKGLNVSYIVGNPATYLYFDATRPGPPCDGMNSYKYGLDGVSQTFVGYPPALLSPQDLWKRYAARQVHYIHGAADFGVGDGRPPALAQGPNRVTRAQNWHTYIQKFGTPAAHSADYVPDVAHDGGAIFSSEPGMRYLFGL